MSRAGRGVDRRRERQKRKQKQAAEKRHHAQAFLGACARLAKGGWLDAAGLPADDSAIDREEWRFRVDSLCGRCGVKPGDSEAWAVLEDILEVAEAPIGVRRALVDKWMAQHPEDPRPRVWLVVDRFQQGDLDAAARDVRAGLAAPCAEGFRSALEGLGRRANFDLLAFAEATVALRAGPARPPARAGSSRRSKSSPPYRRESLSGRGEPRAALPLGEDASRPLLPKRDRPVLERIELAAGSLGELAVLSFEPLRSDAILERLQSRCYDAPEAFELARRGVELLAADHYDRLLSLDALRGVDRLGYQIETVFRVLKRFRGRVLLADEVGLGKTIEAGLVLKEYLLRRQVRRALILVPPALVEQWQAELDEKFAIRSVSTRDTQLRSNPDAFWSSPGVIVASIATARSNAQRANVIRQAFDLVVVDEAHHLKNRRTRGWELVDAMRSQFFLMLTATPVETELGELYNLVTLLRPGTLGTEAEFRRRFVDPDDPTKPVDPGRLRDLLREVMVRNTRALCGVRLPPRSVRSIVVEPSSHEREFYDRLVDAARLGSGRRRSLFRLLLEEGGSSARSVAKTAARALESMDDASLRALLAEIVESARGADGSRKLDVLADLVRGERTLVFTRFRESMAQISEHLVAHGIHVIEFHGGLRGEEKSAAVEEFAACDVSVMVCSEIGGEGQNLQFCHRLINFDLPWNPMSIEQRIGRIHRIGQTETVDVVNLVASGTAEERILDVLDRRIRMFELVIGEVDMLLGDLEDDREFGERVFDIYSGSSTAGDLDRGFDELADRMLEGRRKLERTRALDEALFGEDYDA